MVAHLHVRPVQAPRRKRSERGEGGGACSQSTRHSASVIPAVNKQPRTAPRPNLYTVTELPICRIFTKINTCERGVSQTVEKKDLPDSEDTRLIKTVAND